MTLALLLANAGCVGVAVSALLWARKPRWLTVWWWIVVAVNLVAIGLRLHQGGY